MAGKRRLSDADVVLNSQYTAYRRTARRRGVQFALTLEQAKALFILPCHYCEQTDWRCSSAGRYSVPICIAANGIDRVENSQGYVDGNVVPACQQCNRSKSDLSLQKWLAWAERVIRHRFGRRPRPKNGKGRSAKRA